jgi:Rrf2 family protein
LGIEGAREFAARVGNRLSGALSVVLAPGTRSGVAPDSKRCNHSYQLHRNYLVRFSLKSEYALRAALDLALHASPTALARTADVARRTGAPAKFLEAVLGQLRRAGIIESQRGSRGGHRLARPASEIRASDVIRAVEGPDALASRPAVRRGATGGAAIGSRTLQAVWSEAERALSAALDGVVLEDLARRVQESSGVADFHI